jgi:glyoxalase-like protein
MIAKMEYIGIETFMDFTFIDHFVYATPNLAASIDDLEQQLGVRPSLGGAHTGLGTANALLALGGTTYLEVIGPDVDQPNPGRPRPFGIDDLDEPRLVTWASSSADIDLRGKAAEAAGVDLGSVFDMSRETPDGKLLEWKLTLAPHVLHKGLIPFLIDWGKTKSPAQTLKAQVSLAAFRLYHPNPEGVSKDLCVLGLDCAVRERQGPGLEIDLETPLGLVTLK